jgi:4-aminobutyrate aminotransferase-like enzyme
MPAIEAQEILDLKSSYTIPCLYHFYQDPPVLVRGEMQYLFDAKGNKYLDCYSGVTVMNCGHANPAIIEPAMAQIGTLQHTTSIYLTEPMYRLAEELVAFMDCSLKRVFFVNSGSEANEGALLLAKLYTGKSGFISLHGGLHGRTALTMGLTGIPMWQTDPTPPSNLFQIPRPHCTECVCKNTTGCNFACLDALNDLLQPDHNIAAVILEPIQGNGGIVVLPDGYLEELHKRLKKAGVLLIADEVQTGFCRTGKRFAFQHSDTEPDILTGAKALGNGFPIGVFSAREDIAMCYTKPGASTTGGNAVSATAARAVLAYMQKHKLDQHAAELGMYVKNGLEAIKKTYPLCSDVRGRGLMLAAEITTEIDAPRITDMILEDMKDHGFLIGKTGLNRNVISIMPPLVVNKDNMDAMLQALHKSVQKAWNGLSSDERAMLMRTDAT